MNVLCAAFIRILVANEGDPLAVRRKSRADGCAFAPRQAPGAAASSPHNPGVAPVLALVA
jgi:hypothetical protein